MRSRIFSVARLERFCGTKAGIFGAQSCHQYRAATEKCRACEFRSKCCPGSVHHGRSLIRTEEPPSIRQFTEKMQTQEAKDIYRQRGAVAEFPNAWIKEKLGLRQFRTRGLVKVG